MTDICRICEQAIRPRQQKLSCNHCLDTWHRTCYPGFTLAMFASLKKDGSSWKCHDCCEEVNTNQHKQQQASVSGRHVVTSPAVTVANTPSQETSSTSTAVSSTRTAVSSTGASVSSAGTTVSSAGESVSTSVTAVCSAGTTVSSAGTAVNSAGTGLITAKSAVNSAVNSVRTALSSARTALSSVRPSTNSAGSTVSSTGTNVSPAGTDQSKDETVSKDVSCNRIFKPHPFFEELEDLPTEELPTPNDQFQTTKFVLTWYKEQKWLTKEMVKNGHGIYVRMCKPLPGPQPDEVPALTLFVNSRVVKLINSLDLTKAASLGTTCDPIDITEVCCKGLPLERVFRLKRFHRQGQGSDYRLGVFIMKKRTVEDVVEELKMSSVEPASKTTDMIRKKLSGKEDDDISATSLKASLNCPIGQKRLAVPCRGASCNHLQCVDASSIIGMNVSKPKWRCPICSQPLKYDDIRVDGLFQEILSSVKETVQEVTFDRDGSWTYKTEKPKLVKQSESDCIDLDESLNQSMMKMDIIDLTETDDESEPMTLATPVRQTTNKKSGKSCNKTSSKPCDKTSSKACDKSSRGSAGDKASDKTRKSRTPLADNTALMNEANLQNNRPWKNFTDALNNIVRPSDKGLSSQQDDCSRQKSFSSSVRPRPALHNKHRHRTAPYHRKNNNPSHSHSYNNTYNRNYTGAYYDQNYNGSYNWNYYGNAPDPYYNSGYGTSGTNNQFSFSLQGYIY